MALNIGARRVIGLSPGKGGGGQPPAGSELVTALNAQGVRETVTALNAQGAREPVWARKAT